MAEKVTIGQAAKLAEAQIGSKVTQGQVRRAASALVKEGLIGGRDGEVKEWRFEPAEVDVLAGELWRRRAGWSRRVNVTEGYLAVVEVDGRELVMRVPYARTWDAEARTELAEQTDEIECWEWPTGRQTGRLVRDGERGTLPLYVLREVRDG